jgi:arabinofuranosyltransferase
MILEFIPDSGGNVQESARKPFITFLLVAFGIMLLRTAWVGDDSYITMRTVDNFLHGYGLTWNVGERVQTFTHPLWMMLLVPTYAITRDAYLSLIGLSLIISLVTIYLFLRHGDGEDYSLFIGWCILALSNAFIDYSTSGLENPASHLMVLAFILLYLKWNEQLTQRRILTLALLAGLLTLNRMDLLLLLLPAILAMLLGREPAKRLSPILVGFLPVLAWELFSIVYYGFPFPNTYYAKLNNGISHVALVKQGTLYFFNSVAWDPLTLLVIGVSVILAMIWGSKEQRMISLGILAYLAYVIWIGGDFMSGRFFSAPLLASVILLVAFLHRTTTLQRTIVLAVVVFTGLMATNPSYRAPTTRDDDLENLTGVSDEQAWYYSSTGLLRWGRSSSLPRNQWVYDGRELRDQGVKVYVGKAIGFLGFNAGPGVHVIDVFALSDPLLSHLPVQSKGKVLIGHFGRALPPGYQETLETGVNQIGDPGLANYYEKMALITRGRIWTRERWEAIWKLNTGQYDQLLRQ